jgi:hypothetical protein
VSFVRFRAPEKIYIERYDLAQYDAQVLGFKYVPIITDSNRMSRVVYSSDAIYEVQREILCIPQKNTTFWLMS